MADVCPECIELQDLVNDLTEELEEERQKRCEAEDDRDRFYSALDDICTLARKEL